MVSPSKPSHSRVASQQHSHKCKLIKGPKPLTHFKFYLDIEKHHIESKIEKTIRELGGSIEFFLAKNVTHFVTDKHIDRDGKLLTASPLSQPTPKTPQTPQAFGANQLNDLNDITASPNGGPYDARATCSKPKSRADAMLQRARTVQQHQQSPYENSIRYSNANLSQSPIQLAESWGIPIWTTEYTIKFLDKVSAVLKLDNRSTTISDRLSGNAYRNNPIKGVKSTNVKHLKGEYIKIESFQRQYRPYYQQFKHWPTINLNSGVCPFASDKRDRGQNKRKIKDQVDKTIKVDGSVKINPEMTRKTRNKQVRGTVNGASIKATDIIKHSSEKNCGYCEICRVEYDVLSTHLQTKEHLNFVKNSDNFIALDTLINDSANVETFLKMNSRAHKPTITLNTNATNSPVSSPVSDIDSGIFGKRTVNTVNARPLHNRNLHNNCDGDENMKLDDEDAEENPLNDFTHMNGSANNEQLSPKIIRSPRDTKLPKYSPPMTRRSRTKRPNDKTTTDKPVSPVKVNSIDDGDEASMAAARVRRETVKRINYAEPKEDEELQVEVSNEQKMDEAKNTSDCPPQIKRIYQPFPRYKVIDDGTDANSTTHKSNAIRAEFCENNEEAHIDQDEYNEQLLGKDAAGLIVKFKRVRESELSTLTYEADNFMFPKLKDDVPTDDDRQSTSEHQREPTSELESSELNDTVMISPVIDQKGNESADQFTSSGRRKKRRAQFDSSILDTSKSNRTTPRQRFRESPIQSRNNATIVSESDKEPIVYDRRFKTRRRIVKSARASKSGKASMVAKGQQSNNDANIKSETNDSDDGMGENTYGGGKILSSDLFKQYKFAFERVPCCEPWYLAFQRQDESRERIFEYWGNTAYRKLPFELGPLPPSQPDCCILSKIAELKATKNPRNKRLTKRRSLKSKREPNDSTTENSKDGLAASDLMSTITRSMPRLLSALTDTTRKSASLPNSGVATDDESLSERRKSRKNSLTSKLAAIDMLPAAIPNKKKGVLLDAFGQPRKSPREHASTLAILSGIVQQRRKRFKELNGGISPEKMPNYIQTNGSADVTDDDDCDDESCGTKNTENGDQFDQDSQGSESNSKLEQIAEKISDGNNSSEPECEPPPRRIEPKGHHFLLRKGMRRQASNLKVNDTSKVASTSKRIVATTTTTTTTTATDEAEEVDSNQKDLKYPKMPVDDYIDPNVVAKQLDELLNRCYENLNTDLQDFPLMLDKQSDKVDYPLVTTTTDFVQIVTTVKEGPLSYRSLVNPNKKTGLVSFLQRGKKRRNNKTGWPSVPRRKTVIKREKPDACVTEDVSTLSNTEDDDHGSLGGEVGGDVGCETEGDRIDISSRLLLNKDDEFCIQSSLGLELTDIKEEHDSMDDETIPDPSGIKDEADEDDGDENEDDDGTEEFVTENDNAVSNVFASSSEKAENSDIFTVSSDSLDTADITAERNGEAGKLKSPDCDVPKDNDESSNETEESASDDPCIPELQSKEREKRTFDGSLKLGKMETRGKNDSQSIIHNNPFALQPVVCVKKICEKELYRRAYRRSTSTSPQKHKETTAKLSIATVSTMSTISNTSATCGPTNRNSCSPKSKVSPRKLRKPRGRWYRER